jgi:signal transduction histidine kinase
MNRLAELYELTIFETVPEEQRTAGKAGWWSNTQQSKHIPSSYTRAILLTMDGALLVVAGLIGFTTHAPLITIVGMELLYLGACALFLLARICKRFFPVIGISLVVIGLGMLLNLAFPDTWGDVAFFLLCIIVLYRFPPAWSLPLAGLCILALITTNGSIPVFPVQPPDTGWTLPTSLALVGLLCGVGWSRRTQMLLILRLQQTQALLREQTMRAEELAAEQERTRIARDIHDVLSHSLAVLSIQVQAARHLRTRDPQRLAAKLDEMATLIRESITESRRVIDVLREPPPPSSGQDDLGARVRLIATTFTERTGIHCHVEESGSPHKVSPQQRETLELALREMLTNANRHGAARRVWITVWRRSASLILEAQDDGVGASATPLSLSGDDETSQIPGGHHGLQGMRERAAALGGEVEAGPTVSGGFMVSMRLPFEQPNEKAARRGTEA